MNLNRAAEIANGVTEQVRDAAGTMAASAKTQTEDVARQAAGAARDAYGPVQDQARDVAAAVSESVQRQPLIALLAAGVAGGLLGLLLARR